MNNLVIIETSKCIPDYSSAVPFSPLSSWRGPICRVSWCWLGQNVQFTKLNPIWFCVGIDLIQQSREQQIMWEWMFGCFPVLAGRKPPAPLRTYFLAVRWRIKKVVVESRKLLYHYAASMHIMHPVHTHSLSQFQHENLLSTRSVWASKPLWFVSRILRSEVAIVKSALRLSQAMSLLSQHALTLIYI